MPSKSDTLLILRTHLPGADAADHARAIAREAGYDLCVAYDTSNGAASEITEKLVPVNNAEFARVGLFHHGFNARWQCGDYALYLSYEKYPGYDNYWMIEHDVFFNFADLASAFAEFDKRTDCDFLCLGLSRPSADWHWLSAISLWYERPWKCLFPVARFSNQAVSHLMRRRLIQTKAVEAPDSQAGRLLRANGVEKVWPNDEAFVATTLKEDGFRCEDLNDRGTSYYNSATFQFNWYTSFDTIRKEGFSEKIHHSVVGNEEFEAKKKRRPDLFQSQTS